MTCCGSCSIGDIAVTGTFFSPPSRHRPHPGPPRNALRASGEGEVERRGLRISPRSIRATIARCPNRANHAGRRPGPTPPFVLDRTPAGTAMNRGRHRGLLPRVWMIGVKDKIWSLRQGLFGKYVLALVGLVIFVLAVNGAMETWISYRATRATLTGAMGEKAEATARRIEQSIAELERQVSWVTRAYAQTLAQHNADYAQLLNQVAPVSQLTLLDGAGHEQLKMSRSAARVVGSNADFSRDHPLHRSRHPRRQLFAGRIPRRPALHVDRGVAFRLQCRRHARRYRSFLPRRFPRRGPGRQGGHRLSWSIPAARCWRRRPRDRSWPRIFRSCRRSNRC